LIDQLSRELDPLLARRCSTPLLPASSLNIGRCDGGVDVSTVPSHAVVELDRRLVPGETPTSCQAEIQRFVNAIVADHPGITATVSTSLASPAFITAADAPFVGIMREAARVAGCPDDLTGYRQASDGRFFAEDGIPIVVFGPSDPEVGHAPDEHVAVTDLVSATRTLVELARLAATRW
jgi:acetylornithine deacetylase/succinyl-diaminopimelate desuccinylase-like protein